MAEKMQILEGTTIYEDGVEIGKLELSEGEKAGPFVIIESATLTELRQVDLREDDQALVEGKKHGGLMAMEGRFQFGDKLNANNRMYPDKIWDRILKSDSKYMKRIQGGEMLGEADHPNDGETRLQRVACRVTNVWRNPDNPKEIMGRCVILNTENGKNLRAIHEGGGKLGISSRGQGSVVRLDGHDVVQEDYDLETWDVVYNPSTHGAYPEEVQESVGKPTNIVAKETFGMNNSRLDELSKRLEKYRSRDTSGLSRDAIELLSEEVEGIQEALTSADFGSDAPAAAKLVTEAALFARDLSTLAESKKAGPQAPPDEIVAEKKTPDLIKRPGTAEEVASLIESLSLQGSLEVSENTKLALSAYRGAVNAEGALHGHEMDGVGLAAKKLVESAENFEKEVPEIRAIIKKGGLNEDLATMVTATSERELTEKIKELVGPETLVIEVDRSEMIYEDCAHKFNRLLEEQVLKANSAVEESARNKSDLTELSTKLTTAKQFVEALAKRTKRAEGSLVEAKGNAEAAVELLEAIPGEVAEERIRGAVSALAAMCAHVPGLVEALSQVNSVEEAIEVTQELKERSIPELIREPVVERDERVNEALNENRKVQEGKLEEGKRDNKFSDKKREGLRETTNRVMDHVKAMGGR